jgi:hypothetical protein
VPALQVDVLEQAAPVAFPDQDPEIQQGKLRPEQSAELSTQ